MLFVVIRPSRVGVWTKREQHTHTPPASTASRSLKSVYLYDSEMTSHHFGSPSLTWGTNIKNLTFYRRNSRRPRLGLSTLVKCSPFTEKCPNNMDLKSRSWTLTRRKCHETKFPVSKINAAKIS